MSASASVRPAVVVAARASAHGVGPACLTAGPVLRGPAPRPTAVDLLARTRVERATHFAPPRFQV